MIRVKVVLKDAHYCPIQNFQKQSASKSSVIHVKAKDISQKVRLERGFITVIH